MNKTFIGIGALFIGVLVGVGAESIMSPPAIAKESPIIEPLQVVPTTKGQPAPAIQPGGGCGQ